MELSVLIGCKGQVPDNLLSLLLHGQQEDRHGLLTQHSITVMTVGIQIYSTLILEGK